ncbi:MAG: TIR domain-containing protein [Cyanobacteria bacterium P01_E01_bin.34]
MSITSSPRDCIFISYRRDDARGASGRVWDWLRIGFGRERVFRDVASIGVGKWRLKIDKALSASKACVAVIGRRWADATNLPRLQAPGDMVRYELETALARGEHEELTVVPLLVEEARLNEIPQRELPDSLQPLLSEWNVLVLSESGWDDDTRRLIEAIAEATGLPVQPDLEDWLALMTGAKQGLADRGQDQSPREGDRSGEQQALADLLHKVADASAAERPGLKAAFEAMAVGDTQLAEEAFEREVEASQRLIEAASELIATELQKKGEAARNVASLAVVRGDLNKAVQFFETALEAIPDDLSSALQLGYAWMSLGSLAKAEHRFELLVAQAQELGEQSHEGWGLCGRGDVLVAQGDGPGALAAYQEGMKIREALAQRDPDNTEWQRDLSISHEKIGNVLVAQGDGPGALAAYQEDLKIREALAQRDPDNTQWQVDNAISCSKMGCLEEMLSFEDRRVYLLRGRQILTELKGIGRLHPSQDWIEWFDNAIDSLDEEAT